MYIDKGGVDGWMDSLFRRRTEAHKPTEKKNAGLCLMNSDRVTLPLQCFDIRASPKYLVN